MERGRFRLDDPVHGYLSQVQIQGEDPARPVTIRHLLTHTSGLPAAFGPFPLWHDSVPPPLLDYLRRDLRVLSPPLDSVRYSNLAFTLVAHLVEQFTGEDYKAVIRRQVWGPLEMTSTEFNPRPGSGRPSGRRGSSTGPSGTIRTWCGSRTGRRT